MRARRDRFIVFKLPVCSNNNHRSCQHIFTEKRSVMRSLCAPIPTAELVILVVLAFNILSLLQCGKVRENGCAQIFLKNKLN